MPQISVTSESTSNRGYESISQPPTNIWRPVVVLPHIGESLREYLGYMMATSMAERCTERKMPAALHKGFKNPNDARNIPGLGFDKVSEILRLSAGKRAKTLRREYLGRLSPTTQAPL